MLSILCFLPFIYDTIQVAICTMYERSFLCLAINQERTLRKINKLVVEVRCKPAGPRGKVETANLDPWARPRSQPQSRFQATGPRNHPPRNGTLTENQHIGYRVGVKDDLRSAASGLDTATDINKLR